MNDVIYEEDAMAVYIMFTTEIGVITSLEINGNTTSSTVSWVINASDDLPIKLIIAYVQRRLTMDSQKIRTRDHDSSLEAGSLRPDDSRHFIVSRYMFN